MNAIRQATADHSTASSTAGSVTLVGAGPGAVDLLTVRAVRTLENADVVYYDSLVDEAVLSLIPKSTKRVHVGKRKGSRVMSQQSIQDGMRDEAFAGNHVVRLKGGDPFVFGRGGEELLDLRAQGLDVTVVPGVTAAIGAAAEHGIPLTHRNVSTSVTFVTGHTLDESVPDLEGLVSSKRTLVVYMGVSNADKIARRIIESGLPSTTAVAVLERATLPDQRVICTTLEALAQCKTLEEIKTPALLVIGDVAAFAQSDADTESDDIADEPAPSIPVRPTPVTQPAPTPNQEPFEWVHHPLG
ncbi:MAG: uroporphyrinogen-III C-methyltransferase [Rhodospirillaceae bacterium]|jgi:uroporphyrin-III C-methyltransferase